MAREANHPLAGLAVEARSPVATPVQIEQFLRERIQSGQLQPGDRLPTTQALAELWGVGPVSVQKAMRRLQARGLVRRRTRHGTFVSSPTGNVTLAVLTSGSVADEGFQYGRAVIRALDAEMAQRGWRSMLFSGLRTRWVKSGDNASLAYQDLLDEMRARDLGGVIEVALGWNSFGDVEKDMRLPVVRISSVARYADVINDFFAFGRDAMRWLVDRGVRDVLCMGFVEKGTAYDGVLQAAAQSGLSAPRIQPFEQFSTPAMEASVYRQMLAILDGWEQGERRPQALLVSDDVAMRAVALALVQRQVRVPEDLIVITLANEGIDLHYGIPVVRYEFSPAANARTALDLLDRKMRGEPLPRLPVALPGRIREECDSI